MSLSAHQQSRPQMKNDNFRQQNEADAPPNETKFYRKEANDQSDSVGKETEAAKTIDCAWRRAGNDGESLLLPRNSISGISRSEWDDRTLHNADHDCVSVIDYNRHWDRQRVHSQACALSMTVRLEVNEEEEEGQCLHYTSCWQCAINRQTSYKIGTFHNKKTTKNSFSHLSEINSLLFVTLENNRNGNMGAQSCLLNYDYVRSK